MASNIICLSVQIEHTTQGSFWFLNLKLLEQDELYCQSVGESKRDQVLSLAEPHNTVNLVSEKKYCVLLVLLYFCGFKLKGLHVLLGFCEQLYIRLALAALHFCVILQ